MKTALLIAASLTLLLAAAIYAVSEFVHNTNDNKEDSEE